MFRIEVDTTSCATVPLRKLPSVTEANFSTDLGKFAIIFDSANGAFNPVTTRHQNAWALKVKKCTDGAVHTNAEGVKCPNTSDHETIVTLEEGNGLKASTPATGVGRIAIV